MNPSDLFDQLPGMILQAALNDFGALIAAFGDLWMKYPVRGSLLVIGLIAAAVVPVKTRRRRSR